MEGTPRRRASRRTSRVAFGGVMMETDVAVGLSRPARDDAVGKSCPAKEMVAADGLMGVTGRE